MDASISDIFSEEVNKEDLDVMREVNLFYPKKILGDL